MLWRVSCSCRSGVEQGYSAWEKGKMRRGNENGA